MRIYEERCWSVGLAEAFLLNESFITAKRSRQSMESRTPIVQIKTNVMFINGWFK